MTAVVPQLRTKANKDINHRKTTASSQTAGENVGDQRKFGGKRVE